MKFKSPVYSQVSGSVAGLTYSHNRGGLYARARTIPVDPASALQLARRATFSNIAQAWSGLTQAQRDGWDLYASNVPVIDRLGDSINLSGQMWHQSINTARVAAGLALLTDAPGTMDRGIAGALGASFTDVAAGAGGLEITFDTNAAWVAEDNAALLVYMGEPVSPGRSFFQGPYRFATALAGDSVTPLTSPQTTTAPWTTFASGLNVWGYVRQLRADGRLSSKEQFGPVLTT